MLDHSMMHGTPPHPSSSLLLLFFSSSSLLPLLLFFSSSLLLFFSSSLLLFFSSSLFYSRRINIADAMKYCVSGPRKQRVFIWHPNNCHDSINHIQLHPICGLLVHCFIPSSGV